MDPAATDGGNWVGAILMVVFTLSVLGLLVFIWETISSFFPQPIDPYPLSGPGPWRPTEPVPQGDPMASRIKRAVGYCTAIECDDYAKGVFLLNHGDTFYCPRCKHIGFIEREEGSTTGNFGIYKEVRIEYNYDAEQKRYRELAIVRDESLWGRCDVYHLKSPLIKTEKRALKVAESMLANLNLQVSPLAPGEIPRSHELILSLDNSKEEFSESLQKLRVQIENEASNRVRISRKREVNVAEVGL